MTDAEQAAQWLENDEALARAASLELSSVGTSALGCCVVSWAPKMPVAFMAKAGRPLAERPSPSEVLRSFFLDPLSVPLGQRDRWVDPLQERVVSRNAARSVPVVAFMHAVNVNRSMRHLVCVGPRLAGALVWAWHARSPITARQREELDALATCWRPILRGRALLCWQSPARTPPPAHELTPRQARIVTLVSEGLSNEQVATRLRLAPSTIKTVLERLYRQTGARGRMGLVRWFAGHPLLMR